MKLAYGVLVGICAGLLAGYAASRFMHNGTTGDTCSSIKIDSPLLKNNHSAMPTYRIGIGMPHAALYHKEVCEGFIEKINSFSDRYHVKTQIFYGNDKQVSTAMAEEMILQKFDLLFTIGMMWSQIMAAALKRRADTTPLVFTGVTAPVELGIIPSEEHPGGTVTGVIPSTQSSIDVLPILPYIRPDIRHVLIPWDPLDDGGRMDKQVADIRSYLENRNIKVTEIVIDNTPDITDRMTPFCDSVDAIIIGLASRISMGLEAIIKLCNQHHITLFSYELSAAEKGAAIGWGGYNQDIGAESAMIVDRIFTTGIKAGDIPVVVIHDWIRLAFNPKAMEQQRAPIAPELLFCIKNGTIV